ncbi:MAG: hypothetical protein AAFQ79_12360 [Pseudomonadota bacterium]
MIPQIGVVPSQTVSPGPTTTTALSADVKQAETAVATNVTTQAVAPPRESDAADLQQDAARGELTPPDPDAPTGPPPAFEASVLDRQREAGLSPPDTEAEIDLPFIPPFKSTRAPESEAAPNPYDVPPAPVERAEADVATVRRIEAPYDPATVDVAR